MTTETYKCPSSDIEYKGSCPVVTCPANISKHKRKSGCIYNFLGGKRELDVLDIAYAFNTPVEDVRENVRIGKARIQSTLLLNDILTRIRDRNSRINTCPKCGVIRTSKGPCLNKKFCDERTQLVETIKAEHPYNIPELQIKNQDIFLLIVNMPLIKQFVDQINEQGADVKTSALLGIPKSKISALKALLIRS